MYLKPLFFASNNLLLSLSTDSTFTLQGSTNINPKYQINIGNSKSKDDIQTTDTTKDDNLEKIEQEANLVGTMTFRNFTDSLNNDIEEGGSLIPIKIKKSKPDPFGINAYALELAKGLEEELKEGDTYEKMAAKGKKKGNLKQGTVRKRLRIKDGE